MSFSDALKNMRKDGYASPSPSSDEKSEEGGPRIIKLTDDEAKALASYSQGEEVECKVTGRLNGSDLSVTSVSSPGGSEEKDMAKEVAMGNSGGAPMVQNQTMPSPS